ncbi:thymidine kinase, cytosolic-like isoform X1 [Paramacrobiotus metropolitanus]|uniref:thymidine kinase, cytosolic-like isoform X1 n=1 Tax=Paramacrobiotus metropolitanus TaxID=2943436 RepID=UPI00244571F9|nr:thymidine kinase, cytosolic-like isoform X1 [Paramacrobiotus metropolitanus]
MDNLRNEPVSPRGSRGSIQLIFGPMFSGKTTELLRRINRYKIAKYKVLLLKYAKDVRYEENCVSTHDRHAVPARNAVMLKECTEECYAYDVIGIDEGQFFPDILEFAEHLANCGKTIIVAALDGTFQRGPFGDIVHLVPKAENIVKLSAVCIICNSDAAFTRRYSAETAVGSAQHLSASSLPTPTRPVFQFQVELIGGSDKYMAVCRECYTKDLPLEYSKLTNSEVRQRCSPMKKEFNENVQRDHDLPVRKLF